MTFVGHSRTSSLVNDVNHSMPSNGVLNLPRSQGIQNGGPSRPGGAPLPHIEDILATPVDVDGNLSIRKLLEMAEAALKQAEMARDFNRPALALKDYIRASIIAVQIIGNHRDYTDVKGGRDDFSRAHTVLLNRISQQDAAFARIKQEIIADNMRSGIQPTTRRQEASQAITTDSDPPGSSKAYRAVVDDGLLINSSLSPSKKPRPMIQPKPQALHGKSLKQGTGTGASLPSQDLATRFANLRGPQASPGQDPRIKTHTIVPQRPMGPREMPQKPRVDVGAVALPGLPTLPAAIYSPSRGSVSAEAQRPRPSTPRGVYNRTGSSMSIGGTPTATMQTQADYFTPKQSYSNTIIPPPNPGAPAIQIPNGDTISAEELVMAMRSNGSVLLIDIRARDDFNEGHIMSSSTLCIEPSILLRNNLSADQIAESLVLSPTQEQSMFENRHRYDLVVFYDHDTVEIPKLPRHSDDLAVVSLHLALVQFNFRKELKHPPKILRGGIVAWVDLLGPASLQSSVVKPRDPDQDHDRSVTIERRKSKYAVKSLKPDAVRAWQETLKNDETGTSPNFLRTTEDFLRRFPPISTERESMTSPTRTQTQPKPAYGPSYKANLSTDLPEPPTRPAPALPRPSFTGRSQGGDDTDILEQTNTTVARPQTKPTDQQTSGETTRHYTGLYNPGSWCYANSVLQCLISIPGFGRELTNSGWKRNYKAPRKDDEKIDPPQLMMRMLSNLFHWMSTGKFKAMKAQTLLEYSSYVCKQTDALNHFGDNRQHDAQEFMNFLLNHMEDETDSVRDRPRPAAQPDTENQSLVQATADYWRNRLEYSNSIIDRYFRGIEMGTCICPVCDGVSYNHAIYDCLTLKIPVECRDMTIEQALEVYCQNPIDDWVCEKCYYRGKSHQVLSLARMPPILIVYFGRHHWIDYAANKATKANARISWDFNEIDLARFARNTDNSTSAPGVTDPAFVGPYRYECFAVVEHAGRVITEGHYTAYVREMPSHDPYAWRFINDSRITKVRIGSGDKDDIRDRILKNGKNEVPYLVFFRRKDFHG